MSVRWRIATPRSRPAALAVIDLVADSEAELAAALDRVLGTTPAVGGITLRSMLGIDTGIAARLTGTHALLVPHGGPAVLDAIGHALDALGFEHADSASPRERFPEATTDLEAAMLAALARAKSPLAVDLLLDQPRRWADLGRSEPTDPEPSDRDRRLRRLIEPPLVVAVGPANVGKSSLLNAMVGRQAALVADEAGTTRDHVGATIDLGGLVVHWVDTPGRRDAEGVEALAIRNAEAIIESAELVVGIGDESSPDPRAVSPRLPDVVVAARSDLGEPGWRHDRAVSVQRNTGIEGLVEHIRDALVLPADLESPDPWRFWG